jgi:prevent-host-death family protein
MNVLSISQARSHLSDYANDVAFKGKRICVQRNGKLAFAMVPIEDFKLLESIKDARAVKVTKEALKKGDFITMEEGIKRRK